MELIKLWCEKIYWYKVKPIYVVKKTKSNWLKSDLLRKHLTSSHSYPWITKSDFGKNPTDTFTVHPQVVLHVFCPRIIPKYCKETIAYTTSAVKV